MEYNIYIITLKNRLDRIEEIQKFYKKNLNEINLFYGLPKDIIKLNKKYISNVFCNKFCTIPMVGCASSHILLWKYISETYENNPEKLILIIEDDTFINLEYLNNNLDIIKYLFSYNHNRLFLQLVGEGFFLNKTEKIKNLIFEKYFYHFFLGAYMIKANIAKELYNYYYINKINYHIDFSLNKVFKEKKINTLILKNNSIGEQQGHEDSNMNLSISNKCFDSNNNKKLFYTLNLPIISFFSIVITFSIFFLICLIIFALFTKNIFLFLIIGILLFEIVKFDI